MTALRSKMIADLRLRGLSPRTERVYRSPSTLKVYWAALHFLYAITLRRPEVMADVPRPKVPRRDAAPVWSHTRGA